MNNIDINAKHLIIGFGPTGLSIAKTLKYLGVTTILAMDSRTNPPNQHEIEALVAKSHVGGFDQNLLSECDYLWLSPGVPLSTPELQPTLSRLPKAHIGGDIELFARLANGYDIVGITGTNGKSTVTTLTADILRESGRTTYVGGNLGEPALMLWLKFMNASSNETIELAPIFILELSSFQLETTESLKLNAGAILNLAPDHLDRYPNYEAYIAAKFKLLNMSKKWVVNQDDERLMKFVSDSPPHEMCTFSLMEKNENGWALKMKEGFPFALVKDNVKISIDEIPMGGLHNYANVMAAAALAMSCGVVFNAVIKAIHSFKPLPHRCILVRTLKGVKYFNDSKATNLPSTIAAINGFLEPKWLILGGITKSQDFSELAILLPMSNIKKVILIGLDVNDIVSGIHESVPYFYAKTLENAVEYIHQYATEGDVVLFSPACASFDQFENYNVRGKAFEQIVNKL